MARSQFFEIRDKASFMNCNGADSLQLEVTAEFVPMNFLTRASVMTEGPEVT